MIPFNIKKIRQEAFDEGFKAAIKKVLEELSYDPEYKKVVEYIKFKITLWEN